MQLHVESSALRTPQFRTPATSMPAQILDGKALAAQIQDEIRDQVAEFIENKAWCPCLAAVLVGEDPASEVYVRNKRMACERWASRAGCTGCRPTSQEELLTLIGRLNKSKDRPVHGILVQLPLPKQIDASRGLDAVSPLKDVDAFHPENVGLLVQGTAAVPALHAPRHSAAAGAERH